MDYYYTFIKENEYITISGNGEDPTNVKDLKWTSSHGAAGVLKQMDDIKSVYSPTIGFVSIDNYKNNIYIQIAKFDSIYKNGWRFSETNLPPAGVAGNVGKDEPGVYEPANKSEIIEIDLYKLSPNQIKSIYSQLIAKDLIKFEIPDEDIVAAGFDPKKVSPDQFKLVFEKLEEKGLFKSNEEPKTGGRKGLVKQKVTVTRGGKAFEEYRWVKPGEDVSEEKLKTKPEKVELKEPAIIGLNKPEEEKPEGKPTLVDDVKKNMESHISDLNKTPEGKDTLFRIEQYTGGDYKSFNDYLRTGKMSLRDIKGKARLIKPPKRKKEETDGEIDQVSDFIKNAPKMEGTVYRGMMWKQDKKSTKEFNAFIDQMKEGSEITFPTFSSTSTDASTAMEFATLASKKEPVHSVVIDMQSKNGVYLDGASAFEVEDEVLFDRQSKFKIIGVDRDIDPIKISMAEA